MFPLRDDIPTSSVPVLNYAVIALCSVVFLLQAAAPDDGVRLVYQYGMIPARVTDPDARIQIRLAPEESAHRDEPSSEAPPSAVAPWLTLFTCMFLHGSLMHVLGNMWFLYIFGDNVEDRYGHVGYALLYLGSGLAASLLQLASSPTSPIPTVGASGAIAGVMGAYFVMFRHAQVVTLLPLGVFTQLVAVPAPFFLGIWFLFQLLSAALAPAGVGGVAFWAHVGGFVAGLGTTWLCCRWGWLSPPIPGERAVPTWRRRRVPWD